MPKYERLHSKKQVSELFAEGSSFFQYPFRVVYSIKKSDGGEPPQMLISVSKKNIKKAVGRNRVKRLVREAYRLNKVTLVTASLNQGKTIRFALIYAAKTILSYAEIEKKIILILQRLIEQDEQTAG